MVDRARQPEVGAGKVTSQGPMEQAAKSLPDILTEDPRRHYWIQVYPMTEPGVSRIQRMDFRGQSTHPRVFEELDPEVACRGVPCMRPEA
jgi:hypothetical protein